MTKPTKKQVRPKPAPGKPSAAALDKAVWDVWRRLGELAGRFQDLAEVARDDELHKASVVLAAIRDPKFMESTFHSAETYVKKKHGLLKKREKQEQARVLSNVIESALESGHDTFLIAELIVDELPRLPFLLNRAPRVPTYGYESWHTDQADAVARVAEALDERLCEGQRDVDRLTIAAMKALGCNPKEAENLFAGRAANRPDTTKPGR